MFWPIFERIGLRNDFKAYAFNLTNSLQKGKKLFVSKLFSGQTIWIVRGEGREDTGLKVVIVSGNTLAR